MGVVSHPRAVRVFPSYSVVLCALGVLLAAGAGRAETEDVVVEPSVVPVGGLVLVHVSAVRPSATFEGRRLSFFGARDGSVALLGVDLDHPTGRYPLRIRRGNGSIVERDVEIVGREFPEERLTVPRAYTELDAETLRRVRREQQLLDGVWSRVRPRRLWEGDFVPPAAGEPGSPFGLRRFFNGEPRSPHAGIDIRAALGSPVYAANRGLVVLARELFFTGRTVVLDHGLGLFTVYVHLSQMSVGRGAVVGKGQEIGKVGATGRATGPHLHFAVRVGNARIDPTTLLALRTGAWEGALAREASAPAREDEDRSAR